MLTHMIKHPAGRVGLTIGLAFGFLATLRGKTGKALLLVGLCGMLASRMARS
ncbi:hypothetical protein [Ktedonospora formicarum]|nr:hypothetical protein [Ktedonospora formicarum]